MRSSVVRFVLEAIADIILPPLRVALLVEVVGDGGVEGDMLHHRCGRRGVVANVASGADVQAALDCG